MTPDWSEAERLFGVSRFVAVVANEAVVVERE